MTYSNSLFRRVATSYLPSVLGCSLAACVGLTGCAAELPPVDDDGAEEVVSIGRTTGSVKGGKLTLSPLEGGDVPGEPGASPQGFGTFGSGLVSFTTLSDGIGTGSCTVNQYCGQVVATNNTGRLIDNVYAEILLYEGVTPAGAAVSWAGTPFTASSAYGSVFQNATIEAANYGSFAIGESKTLEWKWNLNNGSPTATEFYFDVDVYASFRRTGVATSVTKRQAPIDACTATGGIPNFFNGQDDAEASLLLPFATTLRDITYDRAVIGSNGYLLLYRTGTAAPTLGASMQTNQTMVNAVPQGYYPFWDDLAFNAGSGVCTAVSGAAPNRTFTVTWHGAKINAAQPAKGTWTAEQTTFSVLLLETVDTALYAYNAPTGGITNLTRGQSATTGYKAILNGKSFAFNFSNNAPSQYIPPLLIDYGSRLRIVQPVANP